MVDLTIDRGRSFLDKLGVLSTHTALHLRYPSALILISLSLLVFTGYDRKEEEIKQVDLSRLNDTDQLHPVAQFVVILYPFVRSFLTLFD